MSDPRNPVHQALARLERATRVIAAETSRTPAALNAVIDAADELLAVASEWLKEKNDDQAA